MPPRTIPWLTEPKHKAISSPSTSSPSLSKRKRDKTPPSDQDLLDSNLNPIGATPPPRRSRPRLSSQARSPSTSPPPAPPSVEYMREGYTFDDAWMMVEDEFFATAQLYTQHLHHAAYAEQKRRAQARGQKLLRSMGRVTDGRTERDGMVVEREEREKAIRKAVGPEDGGDEDEEDDGQVVDPLLGALMNDPRRMGRALEGVGRVKSESRAARGFLRSPEKVKRTFGVGERGVGGDGDDGDEDEESDDLDGPVRKLRSESIPMPKNGHKSATSKPYNHRSADFFKKFAAADGEETYRPGVKANGEDKEKPRRLDDRKHSYDKDVGHAISKPSKPQFASSTDDFEEIPKPRAREGTPDYLKKRRQRKEEEEKRKAKEKKASVEIPTFLF